MRLTQTLLKYIPEWYNLKKTDGAYLKKQKLFYMTRYYRNIGWSTHKNAMNRFQYFLKGEMYFAKLKARRRMDINRSRIAAACDEHGFRYSYLVSTLPKIDIHLNMRALAQLSIYAPKTFQSLVQISLDAQADQLPPANFTAEKV